MFAKPFVAGVHDHRFDIYTLIPEVHDYVDAELGIKHVYELDGVINTRDSNSNLKHHLMPYYEFIPLHALCEECYILKNSLRREEQKLTDLYPWLAEDSER